MFTMDDWLGLVILMVGIALLLALIVNVVIQMWRASRALLVIWRASRKVRAMPMPAAKCVICSALHFDDGKSCDCKPLLAHEPDTRPMTNDEIKAMLPTVGDMSIDYRPSYGIDMGAGDDITTRKFSVPVSLDSIICDLREAIVLEHLEVRSTTRFNNILKRLEAYRDSNLSLPPQ